MHRPDDEVEGFFDDEDDAPSSPSRRKSGLSMAAIEQRDSSFFGFEDPGNAFVDEDDAAWQDEDDLQASTTETAASGDSWSDDLPAVDIADPTRSTRPAGSVSSSRRQ
jgi:hypothetical protein